MVWSYVLHRMAQPDCNSPINKHKLLETTCARVSHDLIWCSCELGKCCVQERELCGNCRRFTELAQCETVPTFTAVRTADWGWRAVEQLFASAEAAERGVNAASAD